MNLKLVGILVLVALAAVFVVQNVDVVEVRFLVWKIAMSRALMFIFLVLIGMGLGWLMRGRQTHSDRDKV